MEIQFCIFTDRARNLGKSAELVDGVPRKSTNVIAGIGDCEVITADFADLPDIIRGLNSKQALINGIPRTPGGKHIVVPMDKERPGTIARTKREFHSPGPSFVMIDHDGDMTREQYLDALRELIPGFDTLARIVTGSASEGFLHNGKKCFTGGHHCYLVVDIGDNIEQLGVDLTRHAWAKGYGCIKLSSVASLLVRNDVFDEAPFKGVNRFDFAGPGVATPPLIWERPPIDYQDGAVLSTTDINIEFGESTSYEPLRRTAESEAKHEIQPARVQKKSEVVNELIKGGMSPAAAKNRVDEFEKGNLLSSTRLYWKDGGVSTVAEVLADPYAFDGKYLRDPHEPRHPRGNARFHADNCTILSFTHGKEIFKLAYDMEGARTALRKTLDDGGDWRAVFQHFDGDAMQLGELRKLVKAKTGAYMNDITETVKRVRRTNNVKEVPHDAVCLPTGSYPHDEFAQDVLPRLKKVNACFISPAGGFVMARDGEMVEITAARFLPLIERLGPIFSSDKPARIACEDVVPLLATDRVDLLNRIERFVNIPLMNPDGSYMKLGFNNGVYVATTFKPKVMALSKAVKTIKRLHAGYDYTDETDLSRAIAHTIGAGMVKNGLVNGRAPANFRLALGTGSQSGKTHGAEADQLIFQGHGAVVLNKKKGTGSIVETIGKLKQSQAEMTLLDNLTLIDEPDWIDGWISNDGTLSFRICGGEFTAPVRHDIVQITSNGLPLTHDMGNRIVVARLNTRAEDYRHEKIDGMTLHEHIKANRELYVGAVYTVIKHWLKQGRPEVDAGTSVFYHDWAAKVGWIMENVFDMPHPLEGHKAIVGQMLDPFFEFAKLVYDTMPLDAVFTAGMFSTGRAADTGQVLDDDELKNHAQRAGRKFAKLFGKSNVVAVGDHYLHRYVASTGHKSYAILDGKDPGDTFKDYETEF